MAWLFPQIGPGERLIGIAKLAAEGEALDDGHNVEYLALDNRSVLCRCNSRRVPFAWTINPYRGCEFACKYCYARYTHEFMELRNGLDFERRIFVKQHTAWLLRQELKKVRAGESIAIGTATDPYQPAERRFETTRSLLEEFAQHRGLNLGLITKSCLILRDVELLQAVARHNKLSIHVTVTTVKTGLARILEPRAPRPDLRLNAVRKLTEAGLHVGVSCSPVLPGITDSPGDLEKVVQAAAAAGARSVFANSLFLKPCSEKIFMPFLEENFPHLAPLYRKRYADRAFLPLEYRRRISTLVKKYAEKYGLGQRQPDGSTDAGLLTPEQQGAEQLGLFA
ncbi:MAG TPA: radical SAM protein [Verrucomicrobiae bacterium]|jgi:DNA repair photolyase|nr:radical SAM protein [Verrucomicrobiae bacterium]